MIPEIISRIEHAGFAIVSRANGKLEYHERGNTIGPTESMLRDLSETKEKVWFFSRYFFELDDQLKEKNVEFVYLPRISSERQKTVQCKNGLIRLLENPNEIICDNISIGSVMKELYCVNLSYELWIHGCKHIDEMCKGVTLNRFLDIVAETADEYHKKQLNPATRTSNTWYGDLARASQATDQLTTEATRENAQLNLNGATRVILPNYYASYSYIVQQDIEDAIARIMGTQNEEL